MECKAYVKDISRDIRSNRINLLITVEGADLAFFEKVKEDMALLLSLVKWKEKRSLTANAYFHVLVGKIADELKESKPYVKNLLISRYGQQDYTSEGVPLIVKTNIPESEVMEWEENHWWPCRHEDGVTFYKVFRPTHKYNKEEMGILIDGTVSEAKNLGIETIPPDKLERMLGAWG